MKTKRMQGICIYVAILFVAFLLLEIYGEVIDLINNDEAVLLDIIEGGAGSCHGDGVSTRSIDSEDACNTHSASHGPGRENGGINILSKGCRNYMGYGFKYGSVNIPYWINMSSINLISNVEHREKMLYDIRYQIGLWNDVAMHDGAGKLINFYEVASDKPKPSEIDGHRVIEILQDDLTAQRLAGVFNYLNYTVKLCYKHTTSEIGYNPDTMVHELGHVLGLEDIDGQDNVPSGTHKTLMGYNRGTDYSTIDSAIAYQDIQGVAVLNNIHTNHSYQRYIFNGNEYLHICFYCDRIDSQSSALAGSNAMNDESTCTHNFMPLVSAGERDWLKCTKCYKVVENAEVRLEYYTNISQSCKLAPKCKKVYKLNVLDPIEYAIKSSSTHNIKVNLYDENMNLVVGSGAFECPQITINRKLAIGTYYYTVENCNNSSSETISTTIEHVHINDINYECIDGTTHRASCACGSSRIQGHVVSKDAFDNGQLFAKCLLCGGRAKLGNVQFGVLANQIQSVTENGSMLLPNGIIVLADADREAYFNGTLVFYDKYKLQVA